MRYLQIDKYVDLNTPLHNWDPRVKLISFTILIFSIVLIDDLKTAAIALFFVIALILISKIPLKFIFAYMKWIYPFILFLFVILMFTAGAEKATLISLRAIAASLLIFLMIATTRFSTTLAALEKLRVPNKLVQVTHFTHRYIFVFMEEIETMLRVMKSRGFRAGMNVYTMQVMGKMIGMLFVRSFERAENVYRAMASRGYTGTTRTMMNFTISWVDMVKAGVIVGVAILFNINGQLMNLINTF